MARLRFIATALAAWASIQAGSSAAEELVIIPAWGNNPFYQAVVQGCQTAGGQMAGTWTCAFQPGVGDPAAEINAIEQATVRNVAGIAVEAINAAISPALETAQENGVRTLTFLSDVDDPAARAAFIDTDEAAFGRALGTLAASHVGNGFPNRPNTYAIVMSAPQSAVQSARADAVRAALSDVGATEVDGSPFPCAQNSNDGRDGLIELGRRSDIGVVVAVVDCTDLVNPGAAISALTQPPPSDHPAVVTACLDPAMLANVGQNGVDGMVCEQPAEIGRLLMETFHTIATGGSAPSDPILVPPVSAPPP